MSKFVKLTVSRPQFAEIYVEVPDEFDLCEHRIRRQDLTKLVRLCNVDWQNDFRPDYDVTESNVVDEKEARRYTVARWDFPPGQEPPLIVPPWPENAIVPDPRCDLDVRHPFGYLLRQEACTTTPPS